MAKPKIYQVDQLQTMVGSMNTAITAAHNQANSAYTQANTASNTSNLVLKTGDTMTGNLTFSGTGLRILGDMSNGTHSNRLLFQTSTSNSSSIVGVIPNGSSTVSQLNLYNNSDPTNTGLLQAIGLSTEITLRAAITGNGTYLPMTFYTGGSERMRIDSSGNVGIGTSSPSARLHVTGNVIITGNTTISDTAYLQIPVGNTAQRPSSAANGMIRFNTTTGSPEWYHGGDATWYAFNTGRAYTVEYLIVAGGGSGGGKDVGGGGGAGGYRTGSSSVTVGTSYTITVGGGGASVNPGQGNDGSSSDAFSITSAGGGGGSAGNNGGTTVGRNGGSGGGGSWSTTAGSGNTPSVSPSQGNNGGTGVGTPGAASGGGGGGAGAAGQNAGTAGTSKGGSGGNGSTWSNGSTYGGGGGGGSDTPYNAPGGTGGGGAGGTTGGAGSAGTTNTGGGGGGAGGFGGGASGAGGSGIVIVRYSGSQRGSGGTVTSAGGYTYHTFTSSSTFTA